MALTSTPVTHARGIVAAPGTSVQPLDGAIVPAPAPIPDNCYLVYVTNPAAVGGAVGLVGIAAPGGTLVAGGDAQSVFPQTTVSFPIGTMSERGIMDEGVAAGTGFVYDADIAVTLEITYFNRLGVST